MLLTGGTYCVETTEEKAASKSRTPCPILEDLSHSVSARSGFFFSKSAETDSVYPVTTVYLQWTTGEPEVNKTT